MFIGAGETWWACFKFEMGRPGLSKVAQLRDDPQWLSRIQTPCCHDLLQGAMFQSWTILRLGLFKSPCPTFFSQRHVCVCVVVCSAVCICTHIYAYLCACMRVHVFMFECRVYVYISLYNCVCVSMHMFGALDSGIHLAQPVLSHRCPWLQLTEGRFTGNNSNSLHKHAFARKSLPLLCHLLIRVIVMDCRWKDFVQSPVCSIWWCGIELLLAVVRECWKSGWRAWIFLPMLDRQPASTSSCQPHCHGDSCPEEEHSCGWRPMP